MIRNSDKVNSRYIAAISLKRHPHSYSWGRAKGCLDIYFSVCYSFHCCPVCIIALYRTGIYRDSKDLPPGTVRLVSPVLMAGSDAGKYPGGSTRWRRGFSMWLSLYVGIVSISRWRRYDCDIRSHVIFCIGLIHMVGIILVFLILQLRSINQLRSE